MAAGIGIHCHWRAPQPGQPNVGGNQRNGLRGASFVSIKDILGLWVASVPYKLLRFPSD